MGNTLEVARLVSVCSEIEGRKKFQKLVYLLQQKGAGFSEPFTLHFFGPYSSELKRELDDLAQIDGVLNEAGSRIGDYYAYVYTPGSRLEEVLVRAGLEESPAWADEAVRLNQMSSRDLEGISTIVYLRKLGRDGEVLEEKFNELKPDLADLYSRLLPEAMLF